VLARRRSAAIIVAVAVGSVVIDQITKTIAEHALRDGPIDLIAGARLVLTYNSGAAFSVGSGRSGIFLVVPTIVVCGLFGYALWARHNLWRAVAFGLIVGGAAGNVVDRLFRDNGGRVIDFIEGARWYPVWNVADMSLFFGILLMLWVSFREPRST
jgi:signal peptidase II